LCKSLVEKGIELNNSFDLFDENNEEIIDYKQFLKGINNLKSRLNKIEIDLIFKEIDTNNTDCVTIEEYYKFIDNRLKDIMNIVKGEVLEKEITVKIFLTIVYFRRFK